MEKALRKSSEKERPAQSALFCAPSIVFMYSGTQGSLFQKVDRHRRSVMMTE